MLMLVGGKTFGPNAIGARLHLAATDPRDLPELRSQTELARLFDVDGTQCVALRFLPDDSEPGYGAEPTRQRSSGLTR